MRIRSLLLVATVLTVATATTTLAASPGGEGDLIEAASLRAELGLDANVLTLASLKGSVRDVGTAKWGIPMTREEDELVDLAGRMAFADDVDTNALPQLRALPAFAGAYYRPADGGRLIVLLTDLDSELVATVAELLPKSGPGWIVQQAEHSEESLLIGIQRAHEMWSRVAPDVQPIGFGIDVIGNGLFVEVTATNLDAATVGAARLGEVLGMSVHARIGLPGRDTHCTTNRDHCHGPMKAGINIYRGASGSNWPCTMGFHISRSGNEEFVTAGHCGFGTPNTWYHPAFASSIGSEPGTLYVQGGQDIMRVSMWDEQASDDIYGDSTNIVGSGTPTTGETLCASLGWGSNVIKCGTVQSSWRSWVSETAGYTVWGGDMSYSTIPGDSGSPVYRRLPGGSGEDARAIGVNTHQNGYFARLDMSLDDFLASVVQ